MNASSPWMEAAGGALLHFLWQGAVLAVALQLVLAAMQSRSSHERYVVRCATFLLMGLCPFLTFAWLYRPSPLAAAGGLSQAAEVGLVQELAPWLVLLWSSGAGLLSLRLLCDCVQVYRLRREGGHELPPRWQACFDRLCEELDVAAQALLVDGPGVVVPAVIGCLRPVVLVPLRLLTGLEDAQIRALLVHELAHIRRHDYLVNLCQSLIESLWFYHPAVWWVSRGIRAEREFCCDDVAVDVSGGALQYARALTALEAWRGQELQLATSSAGGSLMQRIDRLVSPGGRPTSPVARALSLAAALVFLTGLAATACAWSVPDGDEKDKPRIIRLRIERAGSTEEEGKAGARRVYVIRKEENAEDPGPVSITADGSKVLTFTEDGNEVKELTFSWDARSGKRLAFTEDGKNVTVLDSDDVEWVEIQEDGEQKAFRVWTGRLPAEVQWLEVNEAGEDVRVKTTRHGLSFDGEKLPESSYRVEWRPGDEGKRVIHSYRTLDEAGHVVEWRTADEVTFETFDRSGKTQKVQKDQKDPKTQKVEKKDSPHKAAKTPIVVPSGSVIYVVTGQDGGEGATLEVHAGDASEVKRMAGRVLELTEDGHTIRVTGRPVTVEGVVSHPIRVEAPKGSYSIRTRSTEESDAEGERHTVTEYVELPETGKSEKGGEAEAGESGVSYRYRVEGKVLDESGAEVEGTVIHVGPRLIKREAGTVLEVKPKLRSFVKPELEYVVPDLKQRVYRIAPDVKIEGREGDVRVHVLDRDALKVLDGKGLKVLDGEGREVLWKDAQLLRDLDCDVLLQVEPSGVDIEAIIEVEPSVLDVDIESILDVVPEVLERDVELLEIVLPDSKGPEGKSDSTKPEKRDPAVAERAKDGKKHGSIEI